MTKCNVKSCKFQFDEQCTLKEPKIEERDLSIAGVHQTYGYRNMPVCESSVILLR